MKRGFYHRWHIGRLIDKTDTGARPADFLSSHDGCHLSRIRTIERRLSREAPLVKRDPSPDLRRRTLNAIYDLEFHRRYRRIAWWRTSHGGSSLVAAAVLLAGALFGIMTYDARAPLPTRSANLDAPPAHARESLVIANDADPWEEYEGALDLVDESMEIAALASPEWVLRALAPRAIRSELSAMADGALRAADYLVARFTAGLDGEPRESDQRGFSNRAARPRLGR